MKEVGMTERGVRKVLKGKVVGNKMDKTAMVLVSRMKKHKQYNKYFRIYTKYMAHDPQNRCEVGDRVRMIETKPISKRKRWQVAEILRKEVVEEGSKAGESNPLGYSK